MLCGFLDWNRGVVVNKVRDLTRGDATRVMTSSGLSPLGVARHLMFVELDWFDVVFAGLPPTAEMIEPHEDFRVSDGDTVASVIAGYEDACARSRKDVAAASSLDQLSVGEHGFFGRVSLRWILIHMIEETARHAGHLDLMREQIDGNTGD
jgi:hypothetical protein